MNWTKRISIWIIVSLSLQCLGLFYIDHYFLATDGKVVTKKVEENKSAEIKSMDIKTPANAEDILVSYDAKYLSYYENEQLSIVNCKDGKTTNINAEDGAEISFSEWVTGRNRMLLVEKKSDDESSNLILYSYDVSKGEKVKIKELELGGEKSEVEDIQSSTLTGLTFIKISSNGQRNNIYRIDRMGDMTKITTIPNFVSNISLVRHEDKLAYEGLVYNKIYITGRQEPISVNGAEKLSLIGTDDDDNVYIGELKENLISKVYYGKASVDTSKWKVVALQTPAEKNDIFVSANAKVYQNDSLKGVIKDINSGTQTSYQGKLLQLYTKGIVSLVNNKIAFVPFK